MTPIEILEKDYSLEEFKNFATYGCASCPPNNHWNYSQTYEFYNEFEADILTTLEDIHGENPFITFGPKCESLRELTNSIVWCYIETISHHIIDTKVLDDGEDDDC